MSLCYLYDGSFDGLLTAVFEGFSSRRHPDALAVEEGLQVGFGQEVARVATDAGKARRVERGIARKLGAEAHKKAWTAYLSGDPDKATAIYRYLRRGFEVGRNIYNDLAHPDVFAFNKICGLVGWEAHLLIEFLRFSEMEGGVYYARITPEHGVVPLMMPHFVARYSVQPFLIHDAAHHLAGVYDGKGWYMVETQDITLPDESYGELMFRRAWKRFYEAVAVRERYNPRCRRSHMPKKYWKNMTEHNFVETPKTRAADERARRGPAGRQPGWDAGAAKSAGGLALWPQQPAQRLADGGAEDGAEDGFGNAVGQDD